MKWRYRIPASSFWLAIPLLFTISACAQLPLNADEAAKASSLLDATSAAPLKCKIQQWQPALDFSFRFIAGYAVSCRLGLFEGRKATITTYVRITPQGKASVLMGTTSDVPAIPPDMLRSVGGDAGKIKNEIGSSGAFTLGAGNYAVEVLATDNGIRVCRRRWKVRIEPTRTQSKMMLAIAPLAVQPLDRSAWQIDSRPGQGRLRLTIVLNAVPINPYQSTLRAWDRTFLLECLYTMFREIPYQSVRLVAFNSDQQREIFRSDGFDNAAFLALSRSLREMETSTVSVEALKQRNSPRFLLALTNKELTGALPSQAVLFLSPALRADIPVGADRLAAEATALPPFFYFEYVPKPGSAFPDTIQRLVTAANGKTFQIHSPAELDQAIQKMLSQLKQE